jgi:hypothetical protein
MSMKYSNQPLEFIRDFVVMTGIDPRSDRVGSKFLEMLNEVCGTSLSRPPNGANELQGGVCGLHEPGNGYHFANKAELGILSIYGLPQTQPCVPGGYQSGGLQLIGRRKDGLSVQFA